MSFDNDIAIRVSKLSKCYRIYDQPHDRLKQSIYPRLQRLVGKRPKQYFREFWALHDVSFEVKRGETVGIIGKNGSGKSTMLQLICGTLNPTSGSIETNGRIAALLELGSGFNPEFTGRENVYMNAAVLGLSREETEARFDEIAAFADIGDFIEQPVKTYSSGMYVRLAFSVAINVKPDILIVDEALSVGDGAFQLKCMTRLKEIQESGATILFVSHDLSSIGRLCTGAVILDRGRKLPTESVFDSIRTYERILKLQTEKDVGEIKREFHPLKEIYLDSEYPAPIGTQQAVLARIVAFNQQGEQTDKFNSGEQVALSLEIVSEQEFESVIIGFGVRSVQGVRVLGGNNLFQEEKISLSVGVNKISIRFNMNLVEGEYFLNLGLINDDDTGADLDQRWGVRKLTVVSARRQVGVAYTPIEYRKL